MGRAPKSKKDAKQAAKQAAKTGKKYFLTELKDEEKELQEKLKALNSQQKTIQNKLNQGKSVRNPDKQLKTITEQKEKIEIRLIQLRKQLNLTVEKIETNAAVSAGLSSGTVIAPKSSVKEYDKNASTAEWCFGEIDSNGKLNIYTSYPVEVEGLFGKVTTVYDPLKRIITKSFSNTPFTIEMHHDSIEVGTRLINNVFLDGNKIIFSQQTNGVTVEQGSAIITHLEKQAVNIDDIFKVIIDNKFSLDANHSRQNKFFKESIPHGHKRLLAHVHHPDFEKKMIFDSYRLQNVNNTGYNSFIKSLEGTSRTGGNVLEQVLFSTADEGIVEITHDRTNTLAVLLLEPNLSELGILFEEHGAGGEIYQVGSNMDQSARVQKFKQFITDKLQKIKMKKVPLLSEVIESLLVEPPNNFEDKIKLTDIFHDQSDKSRTVAGYQRIFLDKIRNFNSNNQDMIQFIDILEAGGTKIMEEMSKEFIESIGNKIGARDEQTLLNFMQTAGRNHLLAVDVLTTKELKFRSKNYSMAMVPTTLAKTTRNVLKTLMANSTTAKRSDLGRLAIFKVSE